MTPPPLRIDCPLPLSRRRQCNCRPLPTERAGPGPGLPAGRVPRVARLMALALRCAHLRVTGVIRHDAELAALGHVSRARISQILNLLVLAPDIQEALLFLPAVAHGRDPIPFQQLQAIAKVLDWRQQRKLWTALQRRGDAVRSAAKPTRAMP